MGAAMGITMAAQGASSFGGAYAQSKALKSQGDYANQMGQMNAQLADVKASDSIQRGDIEANRNDQRTRGIVGSQRAGLAAQGVDVNSGSAADVQADTAGMGAVDSLTIKNNAWREAWGYKVQSVNDTYQGKFTQMADNYAANNTLLTGGMTAIGDVGKGAYYWKKG